MTQQHPITPPPELVQQWEEDWHHNKGKHIELEPYIAAQAAQWGADQELEACLNWLTDRERFPVGHEAIEELKEDRRPKPPSLKEQALIHFESFAATFETSGGDSDLIRRALEQLPDSQVRNL
jgi:hypothetical protein